MTPPTGTMPPSPPPLAPSGLCGEGEFSEHDRSDVREVDRRRQQVIRERPGEKLPLVVVGEMLEQRPAQPLHDGADRLPVRGERIDDAPDVLDGHVIDELDLPGAGIDGDVRGGGAVRIRMVVVRELRRRRALSCARGPPASASRRETTPSARDRSRLRRRPSGIRSLRPAGCAPSAPLPHSGSRSRPSRWSASGRSRSLPSDKWWSRAAGVCAPSARPARRRRSA